MEIRDGTEDEYVGQIDAGDGGNEGTRAGGEDEAIVGDGDPRGGAHPRTGAIDLHHRIAEVELDVVILVPFWRMQDEIALVVGEHVREVDPIVSGKRLVAEHDQARSPRRRRARGG